MGPPILNLGTFFQILDLGDLGHASCFLEFAPYGHFLVYFPQKYVPILQVGGSTPASTTHTVIRVVLLHSEAADEDLCLNAVNTEQLSIEK